jgi:hypothetical protein
MLTFSVLMFTSSNYIRTDKKAECLARVQANAYSSLVRDRNKISSDYEHVNECAILAVINGIDQCAMQY